MANKLENSIRIDGTIGKDAEFRFTNGGKCVIKFSICYNTGKKNEQGTWDKVPNWFDCQYWHDDPNDKDILIRGQLVKVIGELRQEKWADKETGKERSKVFINVSSIKVLNKDEIFGKSTSQPLSQSNSFEDDSWEDNVPF